MANPVELRTPASASAASVDHASNTSEAPPAESGTAQARSYARALLFVALATGLALLVRSHLAATNLAMVYLLAVVVAAVRCSRRAAVLASFLSVAAFDFFCVPPYYTFAVSEYEYLITFTVMLIVALVISSQTARIRSEAASAAERESTTKALYRLSSRLAPHTRIFDAAVTATEVAEEVFDAQVVIFLPDSGRISFRRRTADRLFLALSEEPVAQWCFETARNAGFGTLHDPKSKALYLPLKGANRVSGVMAVVPNGAALPELHLLGMFAAQTAAAIERIQSNDAAETARIQMRTEEMRSSLLSAVSHDVRTPLAAMTGAATTLRSQGDKLTPEVRAELLDSIVEEAERLSRLVGNILDMTRLESGVELRCELYPLEEIVGSALQRVEAQLTGREILTNLPEDLPLISVDDLLFGQVLVNLLENAAKYTPLGSPIEISARATQDKLELDISDRGPGLNAGDESRIFEKFYRGQRKTGRETRGAGLGLPICKAIIRAHHGTITASNRMDGGAVFHIRLPLEHTI